MQQLIAVFTLLLTLMGAGLPVATPPNAPAAPAQPTARIEKLGYQVNFALDGYKGATPPTVTITSVTGAVYAENQPVNAEGVYVLDTIDRKLAIADLLRYTWTLPDGRTIAGEHMYTNPLSKQQWQVTKTEHLVLFHTAPLAPKEAALLDGAAQRSSDLVGVPLPNPRLAVYLLPDEPSLRELALAFNPDIPLPPTLSGLGGPGQIFIKGSVPVQEKAILVSHESVHGLGSLYNMGFVAEGLPQYAMMLEMAYQAKTEGYVSERQKKFFDNLTTLTQIVKAGGANKVVLGNQPLFEPQDRNMYTVGGAFFLFVRSEYGDEGVRKLFSQYRKDPADMTVLPTFFGETMTEIQRLFNIYIARGEALEDARTLFEYAK